MEFKPNRKSVKLSKAMGLRGWLDRTRLNGVSAIYRGTWAFYLFFNDCAYASQAR